KGIRREFSNARTPQQNRVAERRNRTLIEAARTMLADAKLPVTFWTEAVNTACYVQNRVLVNKSQNKTPYELFNNKTHAIGFLRLFRYHVMILNTLDHLGKFDAKGDEGYFIGNSLSSKAFRVFNKRTKKVEENLQVDFLENKLIKKEAGTKDVASQAVKKDVSSLSYIALPNWFHEAHIETSNDIIKNSDAQDDSQKEQDCNADVPERSGISNPTTTSKVPSADQVEPAVSLTVESKILTAHDAFLESTSSKPYEESSTQVPEGSELSSEARLISKRVANQEESSSLDNILSLTNRSSSYMASTQLGSLRASKIFLGSSWDKKHKNRENCRNEHASLSRDDRHREAFPTVSSLDSRQDRENIAKTSTMPHESSPRVPSLDADEGSMQQILYELMEEMVNVLSSMDAANILSSRGAAFSSARVSTADVFPTVGVPTISGSFPTVSAIFTTASVVTPYTRRSRDAQVAREMEEEFARENQRLSEQVARDSEIARIHAEEELKLMIEGLNRSNEVIAKNLSKYKQAEADLSVGEKTELISELVKYQDHRDKILKGMTLEQIKEKFISVWKQFEDFVPMSSKEESERVKRPRLKLDQGSSKRMKISHTSRSEPSQEQQFKGSKGVSEEELKGMMQLGSKGVSKEELKGMMQLVPLEEVYIEALQQFDREDLHQLWILVEETFSIKQPTSNKEKELWVELKRLFEPDSEDQLWTYDQAFMHDPLDWKLYDTCGVHHVSTKNQEIFMLVEKDYPLSKRLATVMIIQDEELFEASSLVHMSSTAELPLLKTLHCCMKIRFTQSQRRLLGL
nr:ribonuclease H-like domain-containing protein [Tanacetum cinerariifolium]